MCEFYLVSFDSGHLPNQFVLGHRITRLISSFCDELAPCYHLADSSRLRSSEDSATCHFQSWRTYGSTRFISVANQVSGFAPNGVDPTPLACSLCRESHECHLRVRFAQHPLGIYGLISILPGFSKGQFPRRKSSYGRYRSRGTDTYSRANAVDHEPSRPPRLVASHTMWKWRLVINLNFSTSAGAMPTPATSSTCIPGVSIVGRFRSSPR